MLRDEGGGGRDQTWALAGSASSAWPANSVFGRRGRGVERSALLRMEVRDSVEVIVLRGPKARLPGIARTSRRG